MAAGETGGIAFSANGSLNRSLPNGANDYRFYQGRWWYPMANNQWMYWNGTIWANFNAAGAASACQRQWCHGERANIRAAIVV